MSYDLDDQYALDNFLLYTKFYLKNYNYLLAWKVLQKVNSYLDLIQSFQK